MEIPAVSVIIPMYNAEKYIGECLDSILAQTLQDYEVIVVDDCSTDSSAVIVHKYIPKFDGRLQYMKLKVNSGGAPAPRNRGIRFASGEYFYFMDSDDAIIPTALEELYTIAKKFNADVVHCEKYYLAPGESVSTDPKVLKTTSIKKENFVLEPVQDTQDLGERVKKFIREEIWWAPWSCLIKRELILEHGIEFPKLSIADDLLFTFCVYCLAENFVIVPNTVYVWRTLENSNCRARLSPEKTIHRRGGDVLRGIKFFDEFCKTLELFNEYPSYKYQVISFFVNLQMQNLMEVYAQNPFATLSDLLRKELDEIGNDPKITAYLFGRMTLLNISLIRQQNQFAKIILQSKARIAQLENELKQLKAKE